jgi:UDP-3-O-[3-hydroxymyristoyl] glucosamine N-acyltransferase
MEHPGFFDRAGPFALGEVARATGAELASAADPERLIEDVRPLSEAGPAHLSFLDNRKYLGQLHSTAAGACLVLPALADRVPSATVALLSKAPYRGFALALHLFYPQALWPRVARGEGAPPVDPTAQLEDGVVIEPGAVIGPEAMIGRGTRVAAGAVIGARVAIGRGCYIGALATVTHALVGNRVTIHSGVRIGQDGFGFAMGREGHLKVPQIGRVIIQDDVEIGANTAIDRGALKDTIIGEGTKIDNLVQIGHNVVIGRHCVIVAHTGISGSTELGDYVVMGGQSGTVGHIRIGTGAQVAGASHPKEDVPPGTRVGGTPARPLKQWGRELAILAKLAARGREADGSGGGEDA